jgi:hypothetical protein
MSDAKTKPTALSVDRYLADIADDVRRQDCEALAAMMQRVTGCPPVMWGTSIVGFDQHHYRYASGHEGDACMVGFSSRKGDISVYLMAGDEGPERAALYRLAIETGLRQAEIRSLTRGRLILDGPKPHALIPASDTKNGKPARQRITPALAVLLGDLLRGKLPGAKAFAPADRSKRSPGAF